MNSFNKTNLLICITFTFIISVSFSQVGIGTITPDASSEFDVSSTNKGFLPPRMTAIQRNNIVNPAMGLIVYCTNCGNNGELQFFNGSSWVNMIGNSPAIEIIWPVNYMHCYSNNATDIIDVTNPTTGKTWMDRNLGANRAAITSTDTQAYGSLFQWGRGADGHQCVNRYSGDGVTTSSTTSTLSNSDVPGHGNFILGYGAYFDWRDPQNSNLWQGVNGINNPCPIGYRLPTEAEWIAEKNSWNSSNASGAFTSPLKMCTGGYRGSVSGSIINDNDGLYWSSTYSNYYSKALYFYANFASTEIDFQSRGGSVRCIKN